MVLSGFSLIVVTVSAIAAVLMSGHMLLKWSTDSRANSQLKQMNSLFWALVATYGIGNLCKIYEIGPEFFRFHLVDIGFVAAWGGIILNRSYKVVLDGRYRVANRGPVVTFRIGLVFALLLGFAWEVLTAYRISGRGLPGLNYSGKLDWIDISMYCIAFVALWFMSEKMYTVVTPAPQPEKVEAAVRTSISTPKAIPTRQPTSGRVTPKGTPPRPSNKKRRK